MSAIAGIFNLNKEPVSIENINGMMSALEQFPADDIQVWRKNHVFLGNHAQWITPESIGEQQPYYDYQRQCAITSDAIIDNRDELFESLQVEQEDRKNMPDSLLILLSYYKWDEDCPKHLIGDFAFMIWDEKKQRLFGARDPSGYRTLYYYSNLSHLAFCTTIEPLLTLPYIEKQLNEHWLAEFIAITGMIDTVDARMTPYRHINQIPPFHTIKIVKDKVQLTKYGTFYSEEQLKLKSDEYVEGFQEVFQKAVKSRLRTHRNIGSLLSGGLDSGTVVGFAARELRNENKKLHTFSYIPPNDFIDFTPKRVMPDERPYIKKTVEYVGGITDLYFDFEGRSSYSEIDSILESNEMPYKFIENSFWLKGMFEMANKQDIGILLNGDIGNLTVSWGYALPYYALLLKRLRWLHLVQELNQFSKNVGGARLRQIPYIAKIAFPNLDKLFTKNPPSKPALINPMFAEKTGVFKKLKDYGIDESGWFVTANLYKQRRIIFNKIFPWNAGNTLNTKLSLKYSLWKRDPTNDIRVVRFCLAVPEEQFVQNGMDRALIRRSTENILPDQIRLNQRIRGIQGADWIHRLVPSWKSMIEEVRQLSVDKRMTDFIDVNVLKSALKKGEAGPHREYISDPDYKLLTQSIILYRYINKFF